MATNNRRSAGDNTNSVVPSDENGPTGDSDGPVKVLVPIRDPATPPSKRTLDRARALLADGGGELTILHVNLYHECDSTRWTDLKQAVSAYLDDVDANYVVRRGVSVDDVILEEAFDNDVDCIVVGKNTHSRWRRTISRIIASKPDIVSSLHERASCTVDVVD